MLTFACWLQDLDNYQDNDRDDDDDGGGDGEHYHSGAPSGWDDPSNNEVPPPYMHTGNDRHGYHQGSNFNRGDSFVSPAMFVWGRVRSYRKTLMCCKYCVCMIGWMFLSAWIRQALRNNLGMWIL